MSSGCPSETLSSPSGRSPNTAVRLKIWWRRLRSLASQRYLAMKHPPSHMFDTPANISWLFVSCWVSSMEGALIDESILARILENEYVDVLFIVVYAMVVSFVHDYLATVYYFDKYNCLGGTRKLMVEVITLTAPLLLRGVFGYNILALYWLVVLTVDLHVIARFTHIAYDVHALEIISGVLMQILLYTTWERTWILVVGSMSCYSLALYRYWHYTCPDMPIDMKKEVDELPC